MFFNTFTAGANRIDPEDERDPPPEPTPLRFPTYENASTVTWSTSSPPPQLRSLFARVMRPNDVSPRHVEALNIRIEPPCAPDKLLQLKPDGESYMPSDETHQAPETVSYAAATKCNPTTEKKQRDFNERLTELKIDNDDGYRAITKTPKAGAQLPRLAAMRRFWEALENMSQYWDSSLDNYYEVESLDIEPNQNPKRQRLDSGTDQPPMAIDSPKNPSSPGDAITMGQPERAAVSGQIPLPGDCSTDPASDAVLRRRYKGRRTGNGRQMPDQFRVDAVRAFVEGVVWPFQAAVAPPRQMPVVQIDKLNLPVRQTSACYLVPDDRHRARQGFLQGPIFSVQVRSDTNFNPDGACDAVARLDLMREVGGLLQIAQERRREHKKEVKPGEGKWWTTKPRWGGGPGGEVENHVGNTDVLQATGEATGGPASNDRITSGLMRSKKKKTPAMLWKELKCGTGFWDPRTEYQAIGKEPSSEYDEIFMVSSLNHHISILKLTVHAAYVEYLLDPELPNLEPKDPNWFSPRLQRTQWFDLFDVDHRVQAFRALWGVMSYMTRGPQNPKLDLKAVG